MNTFFENKQRQRKEPSDEQISEYRAIAYKEMLKLGATDEEVENLCTKERVATAIRNNRGQKDFAWALLQ